MANKQSGEVTESTADLAPAVHFTDAVLDAMSAQLRTVSAQTIAAVAAEVPGYRDQLDADAQRTLAAAVEMALGGFLALAGEQADPSAPMAPALAGAYALGRGEARTGRSMDALLAAYRVGGRVAWRGMASVAAHAGLPAEGLVAFAELVFAYIDQLSAASVGGHSDELATEDRARQRHLERLGHGLVTGAPAETVDEAAARASWPAPETLLAVLLGQDQIDRVLARIDTRTLQPIEDLSDLPPGCAVLLVPGQGATPPDSLLRALAGTRSVVGPTVPWRTAHTSYRRALRAWSALPRDGVLITDDALAELVVAADLEALTDLRTRALAPLAAVRPAAAHRLAETLRAWLLHRGRRDEVAAALFVHPQTVRYRMGQLRELFGDRLDDPHSILELMVALAIPLPPPDEQPTTG